MVLGVLQVLNGIFLFFSNFLGVSSAIFSIIFHILRYLLIKDKSVSMQLLNSLEELIE